MHERAKDLQNDPGPLLAALRSAWLDGSESLPADDLDPSTIQWLFTIAVKTFIAKRVSGEASFGPFREQSVNATEVVATANAMLEEANIEVFELTLWTGLGSL